MEVVEVERILLVLRGIGVSQNLEETIKMMLGTQAFDLAEHDKQIRAEVIEKVENLMKEFVNFENVDIFVEALRELKEQE